MARNPRFLLPTFYLPIGYLLVVAFMATTIFTTSTADASMHNKLRQDIKYATACSNTKRLQEIGADLRSAFASDFRQSGVYRKLAWNAGKLKRQSARLHRIANRKSECRWEKQIQNLDQIVYTLEQYVAEAHKRIAHRIDPPCYSSALHVDNMLEEASQLVAGLKVAAGVDEIVVERQEYSSEPSQQFEIAPSYNPGPPTVFPEFSEPSLPLEAAPLPLPGDDTPQLNAPFETPVIPDGATIIPDGATIVPGRAPRSVLETPLPFDSSAPSIEQAIPQPAYDATPLTRPLDSPVAPARYDSAKLLKKLNQK